jgi:flagellar hook-length control protein FliK
MMERMFSLPAAENSSKVNEVRLTKMDRKEEKSLKDKSFLETLKSVSKEPERISERKENTSIQELSDKIKKLEENLKKICENSGQSESLPVEEIKSLLEKIKVILQKAAGESSANPFDLKQFNSDLSQLLNSLLSQLSQLLDPSNQKGLQNFLKFWKKNLEEINSIYSSQTGSKDNKTEVLQDNAAGQKISEQETDNKAGNKVKVIDKRSPEEKENPALPSKTAKDSALSEKTAPSIQNEAAAKKIESNKMGQKMDTENSDLLKVREMNLSNNKTEASQNIAAKHYTSYASHVSKANLEALFQNITGKALVTLKDGKSELKMSLTPPELGKMNMKFTFEEGQILGKIVVSTPEAKALFDQNLGDLQRALQQAGILLTNLDVSLGQGEGGGENKSAFEKGSGLYNGENLETVNFDENGIINSKGLYDSSINYLA